MTLNEGKLLTMCELFNCHARQTVKINVKRETIPKFSFFTLLCVHVRVLQHL